ncbi:MAG: M15 family metallopeptidase [Saprospiraceae bacterium]
MKLNKFFLFIVLFIGCKHNNHDVSLTVSTQDSANAENNILYDIPAKKEDATTKSISESTADFQSKFHEIIEENGIVLDIKYATRNNFTKQKIYDCPKCFLRPEVSLKLMDANRYLNEKYKYALKIFDCYRPKPYQQKLWDVVPNPSYVTPPHKGSMHSRGTAVDLTIIDSLGNELDMGTPYDFFGKEAHMDNKNLAPQVLKNRALLRKVMENYGFQGIRTEWWHFSFNSGKYNLEEDLWTCQ